MKAALALHQSTGDTGFLADAESWFGELEDRYWDNDPDNARGGYFFSPSDADDLITRTRNAYDNATPSGNGVMVENLARLYYLTGKQTYRDRADTLVDTFSGLPPQQLLNMPSLLNGFEYLVAAKQVVLIAEPDGGEELERTIIENGGPALVYSRLTPDAELPDSHPAHGKTLSDGKATAYVCSGATCGPPQTEPAALKQVLTGA